MSRYRNAVPVVFLFCLAFPLLPALGAQMVLSSSTTTVELEDYLPYVSFLLPTGESIDVAGLDSGVLSNDTQNWRFENQGTITSADSSGIHLTAPAGGRVSVINGGHVESKATGTGGPSGIRFSGTGYVLNQAGGVIRGPDGVHADNGILYVDNYGTIEGTTGGGSAIYAGLGAEITNQVGGVITGTHFGIDSNAPDRNVVVRNYGLIETDNQAIKLYDGNTYAILNASGATITSGGGSTIEVEGAIGYMINEGVIDADNVGLFSNNNRGQNVYANAGTITAGTGPGIHTAATDANNTIYSLGSISGGDDNPAILIEGSDTLLVLGQTAFFPQIGRNVTGPGSSLTGGAQSKGANNAIRLTDTGSETNALEGFATLTMAGQAWTLSHDLSLTGALRLESGVLTLTGANAFGGGADIAGGRVDAGHDAALGGAPSTVAMAAGTALGFVGDRSLDNPFALSGLATFDTGVGNGILTGIVGGPGGVEKVGDGTLTLAGVNSYAGRTVVQAGTLTVTGSIADTSGLFLSGGAVFDIVSMSTTSLALPQLHISGTNATLDAGANRVDLSGQVLSLNITGANPGNIMLIAGGGLKMADDSRVLIEGIPAMRTGDSLTLVDGLTGDSVFTDRVVIDRLRQYTVGIRNVDDLVLLLSLSSYRAENDAYFNPLGLNNINLQNGSDYLDRLAALPAFNAGIMSRLDDAFFNSLAFGGATASRSLEQVYGSYAAYADEALIITGDRFRSLWKGRNDLFVDSRAAALPSPVATLAAPNALAMTSEAAATSAPAKRMRIWASGFGAWAREDGADNLSGYAYDSRGLALGFGYAPGECLEFGLAAAYSRGDSKVEDLRYRNKPDILNLALHGVYAHPSGVYAQAGLGYGHAWNDYSVAMYLGGGKTGKYGSDAWSADAELGYAARLPKDFSLIPSVGLEYDYLRHGDWAEHTHASALVANRFAAAHDNRIGVPLGLRVNTLFPFGSHGGYIAPELRAAFVWQTENARPSIVGGFAGAPDSVVLYGVEPGRSRWRFGAGVTGRLNARVDFRLEYEFEARAGYRGHNAMATLGVAF